MTQRKKESEEVVDWSTLNGKLFHTFDDDGYVQHQGYILDLVGEEIAIIQYFEWFAGSPSKIQAVWVSDIVDEGWALYGSAEAMNDAYEHGHVRVRPDKGT